MGETVVQRRRKPVASGAGGNGLVGRPSGGSGPLNGLGATSLGPSGWKIDASSWICPRATPSSPIPPPYMSSPSASPRA